MNPKDQVLTFIQEIIEEVKDFDGVIDFDTTLEALALDSLDYVQTQIEAKKRYGVDLTAELFITGQISTVGQLCDYIVEAQSALNSASAPAGTTLNDSSHNPLTTQIQDNAAPAA